MSFLGGNFESYRKANRIKFGGLSYLQVFTLLVGIYLVKMMQTTLLHVPAALKNHRQISHYANKISKSPKQLLSPPLRLAKEFTIGHVFHVTGGDPNCFLKLVEGRKKEGITYIQIPSWSKSFSH